jgi:predicted NBD/HSP70 family sugar kinase
VSVLALDLGGTKVAAGVVDDHGVRSFVVQPWRGRPCTGCGRPGSIETDVSRRSIAVPTLEGLDPLTSTSTARMPEMHVLVRRQLVEPTDAWAAGALEEAG